MTSQRIAFYKSGVDGAVECIPFRGSGIVRAPSVLALALLAFVVVAQPGVTQESDSARVAKVQLILDERRSDVVSLQDELKSGGASATQIMEEFIAKQKLRRAELEKLSPQSEAAPGKFVPLAARLSPDTSNPVRSAVRGRDQVILGYMESGKAEPETESARMDALLEWGKASQKAQVDLSIALEQGRSDKPGVQTDAIVLPERASEVQKETARKRNSQIRELNEIRSAQMSLDERMKALLEWADRNQSVRTPSKPEESFGQ